MGFKVQGAWQGAESDDIKETKRERESESETDSESQS